MNFNSIKETCLYVSDLEASKEFYHTKLGMPVISFVKERHIFFRCGSSVLLCFLPEDSKTKTSPPGHYAHGKQHIAFEVSRSNYEDSLEEVKRLGVDVTDEQTWAKGHRSFYFEDPDGHVLEIVEEGMWD